MFGATTAGQSANEPAKLDVEIHPPPPPQPPPSKPNRKGSFSVDILSLTYLQSSS